MLAAGEGRRMRPLSERWPKAVLPIDRRPVIGLLLRELAAAGAVRATVVVGRLDEQVRALVGDGTRFGLEVSYARQPRPAGSADALSRALRAGARAPLLAVAADTAFAPGDLASVWRSFLASGAAGALCVRSVPVAEVAERSLVRVERGRVARVIEKARPPAGSGRSLAAAPAWLVGDRLVPFVYGAPGPPHELSAAFQAGIDAGEHVAAIEIGPTRDLTRPDDVVRHNFPYLCGEGAGST